MKPNSKLPLQLFAACLIGLLVGKFCFSTTKEKVELSLFNGKPSKLQSVVNIIENRYVDYINMDSLTELTISDMLKHLDPHTRYISAEKRNESDKKINGSFCGVGIHVLDFQDTATVINTELGGPADRAGLLAGDKIIFIDSSYVVNRKALKQAWELLSGPMYSHVKLKVKRTTCDSLIDIDIERNTVAVKSVTAFYKIDPKTGYIKIEGFGSNMMLEFEDALNNLQTTTDSLKNLIIDLRDNGGGLLAQACLLIKQFLKKGDTITYTVNRDNEIERTYTVENKSQELSSKMRVALLVNSESASASEVTAGAIQDNDGGIIVGRRTFGKGLVQTPIQLQDGSLIRLTTLRYYTPSGRSIQKGYEDYNNDLYNRMKNGELDSINAYISKDSTKYHTKNGRIVYSKGGILPDVFVPENRIDTQTIYGKMYKKMIFEHYAAILYNTMSTHDSTSKSQYIEMIVDESKTFNNFINFAINQGIDINIKRDKKYLSANRDKILTQLKASAFYVINDYNNAFKYSNIDDPDIEAAYKVVGDSTQYHNILTTIPEKN